MTLPASQQHALDAIDEVFQSAEPRLATMFGVFTHLTGQEAMPAVETLPPGRWWTRYRLPAAITAPGGSVPRGRAGRRLSRVVLLPLLLIAAAGLLISSLISAGSAGRGCGQAAVMVMAARQRATAGSAARTGGAAGMGGTGCRTASPQPASGSQVAAYPPRGQPHLVPRPDLAWEPDLPGRRMCERAAAGHRRAP